MNKKKYSFGMFDVFAVAVLVAVTAFPFILKAASSDNTAYIEYTIRTDDENSFGPGNAVIVKNSCVGYILTAKDGMVTVGAYAEEKPDGYYISGIPVHIGADMEFYAGTESSSGVCVALERAVVPMTGEINN